MKTNEEIKSYGLTSLNGDYKKYLIYLLENEYEFSKSKDEAENACCELLTKLNKSGDIVYDVCKSECKIYNDPDNKKNTDFYDKLASFLNAASWKNKKNLYFKANEAPYGMITVYYKDKKGEEHHFTIHSDQLGFSAVPCIYFKQNYPLSRYLEMQKNKSDKDPDAIAEFLANYVYTTRTIGGSFLWPETLWKGYNRSRGCAKIEDRVDLTLLEIKHYFEYRDLDDKKKFKYRRDILFSRYKIPDAQTWFGFFDSFEDYVDFFMFNDYVDKDKQTKEYTPINILTGKAFETDYPERETNVLKKASEEELKKMLDLVMDKVKTRSEDMEKLIAKYKQTNDTKGEKHENILHE
ncbi:MAG: hypothetical protein EGR82_04560 [Ruminococcus bicirculans]|nr:hypothetical protein [Ruminococcus bicirculans (ex Wegman et al. 2014)]